MLNADNLQFTIHFGLLVSMKSLKVQLSLFFCFLILSPLIQFTGAGAETSDAWQNACEIYNLGYILSN